MERRSPAFRLPVLVQVNAAVARIHPLLAALPHVADLISRFLDGSVLVTPPQAAEHGSAWLLDRVLLRVTQDPSVDSILISHWLARALEVAIRKNNLTAIQQIHRIHPEPLHVRSLKIALEHASLATVKWIVENRHDRMCCPSGAENLCERCLQAALPSAVVHPNGDEIVTWLASAGVEASHLRGLYRNAKIARWLDSHDVLEVDYAASDIIARGPPAAESLRFLADRGATLPDEKLFLALVNGAYQRELEPVIDVAIASPICDSIRDKFVWGSTRIGGPKVLQWSSKFLTETRAYGTPPMAQKSAYYAAQYCHVDALVWLWQWHGVRPAQVSKRAPATEDDLLALYQWIRDSGVGSWGPDDAVCAARNGYLRVIQWLHKHERNRLTQQSVEVALSEGHISNPPTGMYMGQRAVRSHVMPDSKGLVEG